MTRLILVAAALLLSACETLPTIDGLTTKPAEPAAAPSAPAPAPAVAASSAEQQLLDMERKVATIAQEKGIAAALASVMDPKDGFVVRPGAVFQGSTIQTGLTAAAAVGPFFWQADRIFVSSSGDLGVTSGRFVQVVKGAEALQGRYVMVWRKDADGTWKGLTEVNSVDPRPAAQLAGPPSAAPAPTPRRPRR